MCPGKSGTGMLETDPEKVHVRRILHSNEMSSVFSRDLSAVIMSEADQ